MTSHVSEDELKDAVIQLAQTLGYLVHHDRPARDKDGNWTTHIQGDVGFPDLVLVHRITHTVIFAELKGPRGRTSPAQLEWLLALPDVPPCPECADQGTIPIMDGQGNETEYECDCNTEPPLAPGDTAGYLWDPTHWGHGGGVINRILHHGAGRQPSYPDRDTTRDT